MPDQTRNLNSVTDFTGTLDSNDRIIMTDNKASLKALTTAILGKAMIEGYTGSSLAGSSRSVKSAIDSLNSNLEKNNENRKLLFDKSLLDKTIAPGIYYVITATDVPSGAGEAGFLNIESRQAYNSTIRRLEYIPYASEASYINYTSASTGEYTGWVKQPCRSEITALNSNLSSLYCREYSYAGGTSYKDAVTDVLSKLGSAIARYWIIITIGVSRLSLMIIKDGVQWSNGILTTYGSTTTDVYFVMSRADASSNTVVSIRKLLTGDLEE